MESLPFSNFNCEYDIVNQQLKDLKTKMDHAQIQRSYFGNALARKKTSRAHLIDCIRWKSEMLDYLKWLQDKLKSLVGIQIERNLAEVEEEMDVYKLTSLSNLIDQGVYLFRFMESYEAVFTQIRDIQESDNIIKKMGERDNKEMMDNSELRLGATLAMLHVEELIELVKKIRDDKLLLELGVVSGEIHKTLVKSDFWKSQMRGLSIKLKDLSMKHNDLDQLIRPRVRAGE